MCRHRPAKPPSVSFRVGAVAGKLQHVTFAKKIRDWRAQMSHSVATNIQSHTNGEQRCRSCAN